MGNDSATDWLTLADESLGSTVADSAPEPLTFLLGAGASMSSRGPSNGAVEDALSADARVPRDRVYEDIDLITEFEKHSKLRRLFEGLTPYIGYRAIAALGLERRIFVITLNWDTVVEQACKTMGFEAISVDIQPQAAAQRAAAVKRVAEAVTDHATPGVIVIHLHGILGKEMRFGRKETLQFDSPALEVLRSCFRWTTIVAGTTLRASDNDSAGLIDALAGPETEDSRPLWILTREQESSEGIHGSALANALQRRRSSLNRIPGPEVDFDQVMVGVLAAARGRRWNTMREESTISLPQWKDLVFPEPHILRDQLDYRVVLLTGQGLLGKTTVAHLLAHWRTLLAPPGGERTVIRVGRDQAIAQLADIADPTAGAERILIIEDPYGTDGHEVLPLLADHLTEAIDAEHGTIILSSRRGPWEDEVESPLALTASEPDEWYSRERLTLYTERLKSGAAQRWKARILQGDISTPWFVRQAVLYDTVPLHAGGVVVDSTSMLRQWWAADGMRPIAALVVAARLQNFVDSRPPNRLAGALGLDRDDALRRSRGLLHEYRLDDRRWWKPKHPTVEEAIDRFLAHPIADGAPTGAEAFRELVEGKAALRWTAAALEVWQGLVDARDDDEAWRQMSADAVREWGPSMLTSVAQRSPESAWALAETIRTSDDDAWSLTDLVQAVVELAAELNDSTRAYRLVRQVADDRDRRGAYLVLEAAVVTGSTMEGRLGVLLQSTLDELCTADEPRSVRRELMLCFDGLCWREGPWEAAVRTSMLRRLLEAAERDEVLWGPMAMSCAYHPQVLAELAAAGLPNPLDRVVSMTQDQADEIQWLAEWHLVHQARARALLSRRNYEPELMAYVTRHNGRDHAGAEQNAAVDRLVAGLLTHSAHVGTAVHLVTAISCVSGAVETDTLTQALTHLPEDRDRSMLLAASCYPSAPACVRGPLGQFMERGANREGLLEYLGNGWSLDDVPIEPPRFLPAEDVKHVLDRFRFQWPGLAKAGWEGEHLREIMLEAADLVDQPPPPVVKRRRKIENVDAAGGRVDPERWAEMARRTARGDLRWVDRVAEAARGKRQPQTTLIALLRRAVDQPDQ